MLINLDELRHLQPGERDKQLTTVMLTLCVWWWLVGLSWRLCVFLLKLLNIVSHFCDYSKLQMCHYSTNTWNNQTMASSWTQTVFCGLPRLHETRLSHSILAADFTGSLYDGWACDLQWRRIRPQLSQTFDRLPPPCRLFRLFFCRNITKHFKMCGCAAEGVRSPSGAFTECLPF